MKRPILKMVGNRQQFLVNKLQHRPFYKWSEISMLKRKLDTHQMFTQSHLYFFLIKKCVTNISGQVPEIHFNIIFASSFIYIKRSGPNKLCPDRDSSNRSNRSNVSRVSWQIYEFHNCHSKKEGTGTSQLYTNLDSSNSSRGG